MNKNPGHLGGGYISVYSGYEIGLRKTRSQTFFTESLRYSGEVNIVKVPNGMMGSLFFHAFMVLMKTMQNSPC